MIINPFAFGGVAPPVVATWNPLDKHANIALSNGNNTASKTTSPGEVSVRATIGIAASSKGYFEIRTDSVGNFQLVGVGDASASLNSFVGSDTHGWAYYQDTGGKYSNNTETAYGTSWKAVGDVIGVAFDNGKIWFAKNNTWQNSGDPVAGTGEAFSGIAGTIYPMLSVEAVSPQDVVTGRFALADFTYTPPTGFPAWGN